MIMREMPYRQIHLDFHTSPFIGEVGRRFDAEKFAKTLKNAKVESVNVFAKCHHGMCYYPTKIGKMHPGLKFDLLGGMISACHREGIKAPVYFPTGWEENAAEHADWLEVDADGVLGGKQPFESGYYRWRKLCHNKEEYIRYILGQTEELLDLYDVDGFWYDIVRQDQCVCGDCRAEMERLGLDPGDIGDVRKHDFIVIERFINRIYTFIKQRKPDASVYFNMSLDPDGGLGRDFSIKKKIRYMTHLEIESLPSGEWGYNHFPLYVNFHNHGGMQVIGMTGKFHKSWGDFGSLKNKAALEYECFRMIASGAKCCIGDQMHPSGELDAAVYKRIGEVYGRIESVEHLCRNTEKIAEIGILSANNPLEKESLPDEGAMRMLLELHRPFDLVDRYDGFDRYSVMILPDKVIFDDELTNKINRYLENGGAVIASYRSGMDPEGRFRFDKSGVGFLGDNPFCPSYIRLEDDFRGDIEELDYVMYEQGARIEAEDSAEVLAYTGAPYFNRSYRRFCSHCQTPFEKLTDWPAITRKKNVIYIAGSIFTDYINSGLKVCRDIVRRSIGLLTDKPMVVTELPSTAEITLRKQDNRYILHLLNYIPQRRCKSLDIVEDRIPLYDRKVKVRLPAGPARVYTAFGAQELPFSWEDGYAAATVPEIDGYQIVVFEI